jgi:outer membrane immunogenic protein
VCRRPATIFHANLGKKKIWTDVNNRTVAMKKALFSGAALAALLCGSAMAADLRAPIYKGPVPQSFSWTGLYFGSHTGAAVGDSRISNVAPFGGFDAGAPLSYDLTPVGIFGGGQIGYNWQVSNIVFGAEIDAGWLNARSRLTQNDDITEARYGAYGTFTGRAGLAMDRLLSYVKGGAVLASIRNTAADTDGSVVDPTDFSQITRARWGWTIGSGFEYAIASNWTVKSEYLYMDFGTQRSTNLDGDAFEHRNRLHTWKIGLNYKWGGMSGL